MIAADYLTPWAIVDYLPLAIDNQPLPASPIFVDGFKRRDLYALFHRLGYTRGAEIGVAQAKNAFDICTAIPGLQYLGVDPWCRYRGNSRARPTDVMEAQYQESLERLRSFHATLLRMMSVEAAATIPDGSLDWVYIDGNHAYEYVRDDLAAWSPKVRSGGIVSGHDYYEFRGAGVIRAVNAFTAAHQIEPWFLTDARRIRRTDGDTYYRDSSFFWVQP